MPQFLTLSTALHSRPFLQLWTDILPLASARAPPPTHTYSGLYSLLGKPPKSSLSRKAAFPPSPKALFLDFRPHLTAQVSCMVCKLFEVRDGHHIVLCLLLLPALESTTVLSTKQELKTLGRLNQRPPVPPSTVNICCTHQGPQAW